MPATLRHFAINADDVPRAKAFYETVFGWNFTPGGPPGFYQTNDVGEGRIGALHGRRAVGGQAMPGMELTFGVEDRLRFDPRKSRKDADQASARSASLCGLK